MNEIVQLFPTYNDATKTLVIDRPPQFDDERLSFSDIVSIFYGKKGVDLDLCDQSHYEYKLAPDTVLEKLLVKPSATMQLIHKGGVLPDLNLTVRIFDEGIINVKWTWWDTANNKVRHHPEIPKLIVDTTRPTPAGQEIGRHVIITADPFTIQFVVQQGQTEPLFEIDRFVYDSYLNWVGMRALSTLKDNKFRGVMGLGERSSSKLFFDDGIYSMNAFDQSTSEDTGSGGKQTYGVHPFFMFQHSADKWVGVFSKQAHAQDWVIMNDKPNGRTTLKQIATGGISDFYIMINSNTPDSVIGYYQRIVGKPVLMPQWSLGWH
jgi:hypothetical protein